ncbi:hypothetical protein EVAR_49451_1 [Eumeta japonica]|uniref:Uncharacterized protein n=1 Tax=Eumeta variegata TaxID=151549 RepID=A0A4C1Y0T8_EUMVA|nr:hypothetical protein EVAR_49451_1 [Eumeta japonica]
MCGNKHCDYPFNTDDIQIVETEELGLDSDPDCDVFEDVTISENISETCSISKGITALEGTNKKQNTKDIVDLKEYLQSRSDSPLKKKRKEDILEEKLCKTNQLFYQLYEENEPSVNITNSKWIKNLLNMQTTTKTKLLTNEEVCFLGINSPNDAVVKPKLNINLDQNGDIENVKVISDDDSEDNC